MFLDVTSVLSTHQPLSTSHSRAAAAIVAASSLLSTIASVFIAIQTIRDATTRLLDRTHCTTQSPGIRFLRTQLGHFTVCLIISNAFISVAGLINFGWLRHSELNQGPVCTTQAVLMQIGLWGICWFTTVHGVHTLISFVFRVRQDRWRSVAIISIGWVAAFVAGLVPMRKNNPYGPSEITCGILRSHSKEMFFLGAVPIIWGASTSAVVYAIMLTVLYRRRSGSKPTSQRENVSKEYYKFIGEVIWTMFWFPFAFVFLLSPLCVVYILLCAGYRVPLAVRVFADSCASLLGIVHVGLLCNTLRVISPTSRAARFVADTVMTFGHDASCESPTAPHPGFYPQPIVPAYESRYGTYDSTREFFNHSHSLSLSSVDSKTGLIDAEKSSHKPARTALHIVLPADLGKGFDTGQEIAMSHHEAENRNTDAQCVMVESPMDTVSLSPALPCALTKVVKHVHEPRTQDEKQPLERLMTDNGTFGKKTLRLSSFSDSDTLFEPIAVSPLDVTSKSAALVTRLGISSSPTPTPSLQKFDEAPVFPLTLVPRLETHLWRPDGADETSLRHLSTSSYDSTGMYSTDESQYSGEVMQAYKVCADLQLGRDEESEDAMDALSKPHPAWCRRMTTATVWSQESGYTMSQLVDEEDQEAYWQVIADMLDPDMSSIKRVTVARPVTLRVKAGSVHPPSGIT